MAQQVWKGSFKAFNDTDESFLYRPGAKAYANLSGVNDLQMGFDRISAFRKNLQRIDEEGFRPRNREQAEVHNFALPSMAKILFGCQCFTLNKNQVMMQMNWTLQDLIQAIEVLAPRRWGKSELCAQLLAAGVVTIPYFSALIFSKNLKQTKEVIAKTLFYLTTVFSEYPIHHSKQELSLQMGNGDYRWIRALAGDAKISLSLYSLYSLYSLDSLHCPLLDSFPLGDESRRGLFLFNKSQVAVTFPMPKDNPVEQNYESVHKSKTSFPLLEYPHHIVQIHKVLKPHLKDLEKHPPQREAWIYAPHRLIIV